MHFVGDQPATPSSCLSKEPRGVVSGRPGDRGDCGLYHLEIPSMVVWLDLCLKYFTKETACHVRKAQSTLAVQSMPVVAAAATGWALCLQALHRLLWICDSGM